MCVRVSSIYFQISSIVKSKNSSINSQVPETFHWGKTPFSLYSRSLFFLDGEERVRFWHKRMAVLHRGFLPRVRGIYFKTFVGEVFLDPTFPHLITHPSSLHARTYQGWEQFSFQLFKSLHCSYFLWNRPPLSLEIFMGNNIFVQLKASPVLLSQFLSECK